MRFKLSLFFTALLCVSFVTAVDVPSSDFGSQAEGVADQVKDTTQTLEDINKLKFEYLADQWKNALLNNTYISRADYVFTKLDPAFIVLFGRHYSLSLEMFFVFVLWVFTFVSIKNYKFITSEKYERLNILFSVLIVVIIAQMRVFSYFAKAMVAAIFYQSSVLWSIVTFVFLIIATFVYLYIMRFITLKFAKQREEAKAKEMQQKVDVNSRFIKGVKSGVS